MKKIIPTVFSAILLMVSTFAFAQTDLDLKIYDENGFRLDQDLSVSSPLPVPIISSTTDTSVQSSKDLGSFKQGEPGSCFDYYTFGSIDVNLQTDTGTYEAGSPVLIRGQITNNNRYPVTNLTVRARLVRNIPDPVYLRSEIITVDDFNIVENITLNASSSADVNYSHLLPLNAPEGEYKIFFYAYNNERFNQTGLSFTNDIVTSRLLFNVTGNNLQQIYLDQTGITLNNQEHNVMAFMTQHEKDTLINVSLPLVNPSNQDENMIVTYTLYKWDGLRKENIVDTKTENIKVRAKDKTQLTYVVEKTDSSVYFLNITADNQNQTRDKSVYNIKTESNIRFVVNGYDFPRINSFGVDTYPLKEGEEATLFTCYHNGANQETLNPLNISTVLYDEKGKIITQTEYEGKIGGGIQAIIKKFTTTRDLVNFKTVTTLSDDTGMVIDTIENDYNCKDLDPTLCPKSINYTLLGSILGLVVLIILILLIRKMKHKVNLPTVMFLFVFLPMSLFGSAEAAIRTAPFGISIGGHSPEDCRKDWDLDMETLTGLMRGSFQKEFNFVKSGVNLSDSSINSISVGDTFDASSSPTTGDWFAAGFYDDSPPMDGVLYNPPADNRLYDEVSNMGACYDDFNSLEGSLGPVSVSVPMESGSINIVSSNPDIVSCTNNVCTANSTGTTTIVVSFEDVEQILSKIVRPTYGGYYENRLAGEVAGRSGNQGFGKVNVLSPQFNVATHPFSFLPITYTISVEGGNTPHTTSCSAATNITPNSATINWIYSDVDNDPQTQYQVQLSTKPFNDPSFNIATDVAFNASGIGAATSHTFTGISSGTTYYSRVKTWNSQNGEGTWSECGNSFNTGSVPGCNDTAAVNYNSSATSNDGSCTYTCDVNVTFATRLNRQFGSLDVDVGITNLNLNNLSVTSASLLAKNLTTLPESWRSTSGTEPLPAGTDNYAMTYTSWLNQINLLYAEPARTQLINTYGYMPFDGKYSESLPYWRTANITLPALGSITIPNALSYYNRYRASTNPFTLSLISPDCKPPTGPTFTVSCSSSPNPVVFPTKTTTFTANTTATSPTYRWESSTGTTLGTGSTLSQTYATGQDTIHNINLYVTKGTETNSASCSVLVKCNDDHYEDKPDTACNPITNTQNVYTCTSTGWSTVSKPCTPPATEPQASFTFSPDIVVNASGKCGLTMSATDVSSCRLVSTINTLDLTSYISSGSINLNKSLIVPVGRYTLSCTGVGPGAITKSFGVKSCILNPDFREN